MSPHDPQNEPPSPEVDPDNVEFVIFIRAKNVRESEGYPGLSHTAAACLHHADRQDSCPDMITPSFRSSVHGREDEGHDELITLGTSDHCQGWPGAQLGLFLGSPLACGQ